MLLQAIAVQHLLAAQSHRDGNIPGRIRRPSYVGNHRLPTSFLANISAPLRLRRQAASTSNSNSGSPATGKKKRSSKPNTTPDNDNTAGTATISHDRADTAASTTPQPMRPASPLETEGGKKYQDLDPLNIEKYLYAFVPVLVLSGSTSPLLAILRSMH